MSRHVAWRATDFMARAAFRGENGFMRDKRLLVLALVLGAGAIFLGYEWMGFGLIALIVGVLFADVRRYNREHSDG